MLSIPRTIFFCLTVLVFLLAGVKAQAGWSYDWSTRTDIYGNEAGHLEVTPFPIDENTTQYSIENDEGIHTYQLGTKYFVDGLDGNDSNDGLSFDSPKRTLSSAASAAGSGNVTIIVRGAHDGWDGIYNNPSLSLSNRNGINDSQRFTIVGYEQERPIFNGGSGIMFSGNSGPDYFTLQRVKLQNATGRAIRLQNANYVNIIDIWMYNNCSECYIGGSNTGDGNLHFFPVDNAWLYHNTSEHTYMKGFKVADDSDDMLVEWNVANETGYWEGIPNTPYAHAYGYDFAADSVSGDNKNPVIRYNIGGQALLGNECRFCTNYDIHHNEFYDSVHADDFSNEKSGWSSVANFMIRNASSYGEFYSNVVRDNTDTQYPHLLSVATIDNTETNLLYNNILSGTTDDALYVSVLAGDTIRVKFLNNTIYGSNNRQLIDARDSDISSSDDSVEILNNIIYQDGTGACVSLDSDVDHSFNQYFYPNGSRGVSLDPTEVDEDPEFLNIPTINPFDYSQYTLTSNHFGTDLSQYFIDDFLGSVRLLWTRGALDQIFGGTIDSVAPGAPTNLTIPAQ